MQISFHNLRNYWALGQFYMVLSHFAELGSSARLYLLKNKTIGRLLDVFFNWDLSRPSPLSTKFRNESLAKIPLFVFDKTLYIESNLQKADVRISEIERKNSISTATPCFMFLLYTVSTLARSCLFVKSPNKSPLANDEIGFVLDQDELTMLSDHLNENWWLNC